MSGFLETIIDLIPKRLKKKVSPRVLRKIAKAAIHRAGNDVKRVLRIVRDTIEKDKRV